MKIDTIITNYHREDLLGQLLYRLDLAGRELINTIIIHHDGQQESDISGDSNMELFSFPRVGQVMAIDKLMERVTTEYYFSCEEDFHPIDSVDEGIKEAISILDENPDCASVSLRGPSIQSHNGHPHEEVDGIFRMKKGWQGWSGWSYAPSVRRLSDYKKPYASMATWDKNYPWLAEKKIGEAMTGSGWCATTRKPYFVHVGGSRSTVGK